MPTIAEAGRGAAGATSTGLGASRADVDGTVAPSTDRVVADCHCPTRHRPGPPAQARARPLLVAPRRLRHHGAMTSAPIKIHVSGLPFTRDCRPRWLLSELGVAYETVPVKIFGERPPEYLAVNPTGKVPFLEEADARIFESGAIVIYLADRYGAGVLAPRLDDAERAAYLQWIFFTQLNLEGPVARLFANRTFLRDRPGAAERAQEAQAEAQAKAALLEAHLATHAHLVGDRFTAADIMLGSTLFWMDRSQGLDGLPALRAYFERLRERPAFQTTFA